jgi:hypothetical protein
MQDHDIRDADAPPTRIRKAAELALKHAADGFTIPMLAEALGCSEQVASKTRAELERQLEDSPIQLRDMAGSGTPRNGWATGDDHHHDRHLYRLIADDGTCPEAE